MFFASGRNVMLIKHPRYLPFFLHRHAFFEMLYVLEGSCAQTIDGKAITLRQGDLCLLSPSVSHGIEVSESVTLILLR